MSEVKTDAVVGEAITAVPTKSDKPQKLTAEQTALLFQFIGKCVFKNIGLPGGNKFNVATRLTVQDICNASLVTITNLAKSIKKAINDDDSEFNTNGKPLEISGIKAEEWLTFMRNLLQKKRFDEFAAEQRYKITTLKAAIAGDLTPGERREKNEKALAELTSQFSEEEV